MNLQQLLTEGINPALGMSNRFSAVIYLLWLVAEGAYAFLRCSLPTLPTYPIFKETSVIYFVAASALFLLLRPYFISDTLRYLLRWTILIHLLILTSVALHYVFKVGPRRNQLDLCWLGCRSAILGFCILTEARFGLNKALKSHSKDSKVR